MSEREYEALRSALASTRMEGFDVTEQTEKDCVERQLQRQVFFSNAASNMFLPGKPDF